MQAAAIDAGSNTLRLLIGKVVDDQVVPALYQRRICRLAGGSSLQEGLSVEARERTLAVFREFSATCREAGAERIRAVGTAAFRHAANGEDFASLVRESTGLPLQIISGEAEASYTARGVVSALRPVPAHTLIFDIGGGSTEFVLCAAGRVKWSRSFPLGVVHLTETYPASRDRQAEISRMLALIQAEVEHACFSSGVNPAELTPVGTAGTVTTLAALDMQMAEYDWRRVNNHRMSYTTLQRWYESLSPLTPRKRELLPGMERGRGDLIISGLEIILDLMRAMRSEHLIVSDFGLLEGLLLSLYDSAACRSFR